MILNQLRGFGVSQIVRRSLYTHPDYVVGQELCKKNWKVISVQDVEELNIRSIELSHKNSGTKFLHLSADDQTNAFSVGFRTIPQNSTGISHILEHVSLCGSQKYPVRDPFFKMLNRSLSTFMNAMTGPDYTFYPFSTQNKADFYNLLSVYLDSVFKPLLKEQDFRQEGWRLEKENLNDPNSKLIIKGVVFNEMKGVYADSQQVFGRHLLRNVLPSHTYGYCSGGLPKNIPELTWEMLKDFHKKHYSPYNAKFITYGNLNLEEHLQAINDYIPEEKVLDKDLVQFVPNEPRWSKPKVVEISCAPDPSDPDSSTIAMSYATCDILDKYECFVLQILDNLLLDGPNAPFYKSLIEAGLGSGFSPSAGFGAQTKDALFTVGLQGIKSEKKELVKKAIEKTFQDAYETGFDSDRVEAILHRTELSMKIKKNNFGVGLVMAILPLWNHLTDLPSDALKINKTIKRFRKEMSEDPDLLKKYIKKYFINNQHKLTLVMSPKETYSKEEQDVLDKVEAKAIKDLMNEDIKTISEKNTKLQEEQNLIEDISCLPTLKVSDIADSHPRFELDHEKLNGVPVQISAQPTNEVAFFRALLGINDMPEELREVLPLFTMILSSLGAGKFDYRKMDTEIDLRTGGISAGVSFYEKASNKNMIKECVLLSSYCLHRNTDKMFELLSSIFLDLHVNNPEHIKNLIGIMATDLMNGIVHSGHSYAMGSSASSLQPGTFNKNKLGGFNSLRLLNRLNQAEKLDDLIEKLSKIAKLVLSKSRMEIALNTTPDHVNYLKNSTNEFLTSISGECQTIPYVDYSNFEAKSQKLYYLTPFPIHFCSKSIPIVNFEHQDFAPLRIMSRLVSLKYLHREIREKGGAYGSGVVPNSAGVLSFFSYRDPNSSATLDVFDGSLSWLESNKLSDQDIDEAKLGVFQSVDAPVVPGARGMREFLSNISDDDFHKHRMALKAVTYEDILRVGRKYLTPNNGPNGITIIGPTTKNLDNTWNVQEIF